MSPQAPGAPGEQLSLPLDEEPGPETDPPLPRRRLARRRPVTGRTPTQTSFSVLDSPARDRLEAAGLGRLLSAALGRRVSIVLTDNRSTVVSFRPRGSDLVVRLHGMFLDAPPDVIAALGRWIASRDRRASRAIDRFVRAARAGLPVRRPRPEPRRTAGASHDLGQVLVDLDRRFFGGHFDGEITWGRRASRRRQRTIRLGSYSPEERLIRINPALDRPFVPRYFVEWVVYHEMLHHVLGVPVVEGRRRIHTAAFRAMERAFPEAERAADWEKANVGRLLRR